MYKVGDIIRTIDPGGRHGGAGWREGFIGKISRTTPNGGDEQVLWFEEIDNGELGIYSWAVEYADEKLREKYRKEQEKKEAAMSKFLYKGNDILALGTEIFGEERVDLQGNSLIIWFPTLVISNSRGNSHKIKDLYVQLSIPSSLEDYNYQINVLGTRKTLSLKEKECSYAHSHLSSSATMSFQQFCLGASEFATILENLRLDPIRENWEMLLYSLENYLSWESLEGGPYHLMANIKYRDNNTNVSAEFNKIREKIPISCFEFADGMKFIKNKGEFREFLNEHSPIKSVSGYSKEQIADVIKSHEYGWNHSFKTFKGKQIPNVIYCDDVHDEKTVSKEIVELFEMEIEKQLIEFNNKLSYEQSKRNQEGKVFGKAGAIKHSFLSDNRKTSKADRLPA